MKASKHPKDLTENETAAIVAAFDQATDLEYSVTNGATARPVKVQVNDSSDA